MNKKYKSTCGREFDAPLEREKHQGLCEDCFLSDRAKGFKSELEQAAILNSKGVPFVQALVVAGDQTHAKVVTAQLQRGEITPVQGLARVGSYARFEWARENLPAAEFFKRLPELWVGSDPDDTTKDALKVWKTAFKLNRGIITDKEPLPEESTFTVYRGQIGPDAIGVSWSLRFGTAVAFARTGGGRVQVPGGHLVTGVVARDKILAYLTGRGEEEVVIDPADVKIVSNRLLNGG